jgi:hypothetical protein
MFRRNPVARRDVTGYHGTASDYDAFDLGKGGALTGARSAKKAAWFTDDTKTAGSYAVYAAEDGPIRDALAEARRVDAMENPPIEQAESSWVESRWQGYAADPMRLNGFGY